MRVSSEFSLFRTDIAPLLQLGSNTLYVNAANGAVGPAGLIFSATITTTPIPEPSALMLGAVVSTLGYGWRYGRQQWRIALLRS